MTSTPAPVAPDPELVAELTDIWSEVLDAPAEEVSPEDTFLTLGGDSVLAVRMAAAVQRRTGVALPLRDVRVELTLAELVERVAARRLEVGGGRALPVTVDRRADPAAPFPLLPLQQGYFVGQQGGWELSYATAHFTGDTALSEVEPEDVVEELTAALDRLVAHQPGLRCRVTPDGVQRLLPAGDAATRIPLTVVDLREAGAEDAAGQVVAIREELAGTGPDPATGPPVEVRLALLPDDVGRLFLSCSLLAVDGWSFAVLMRELVTFCADPNAVLLPLEIDLGDYVEAVGRLRALPDWAADRDWWWERVDALPAAPALPLVRDPAEVAPTRMGAREARLPGPRWAALRAACAERGVTPSAALVAVYASAVARAAGHRRFLLSTLQHARLPLHPDVTRLIGGIAATALLPVDLAPGAPLVEHARQVQAELAEVGAHALVSGTEVVREVGRRRGATLPVAPVVFQSTLGLDAALGDEVAEFAGALGFVDLADFVQHLRTPQVALELRLYELRGELVIAFSVVEELFGPGTIDAIVDEVVGTTAALADGGGWDCVPDLPGAVDPPAGTGLLQGAQPAAAADRPGPPAGPDEDVVAQLWAEVLEVDVDDRAAPFAALGGDSLLAVRMLGRLGAATGTQVPLPAFLAAPTVAGLARALAAARG
jgi:acyl carrier protein